MHYTKYQLIALAQLNFAFLGSKYFFTFKTSIAPSTRTTMLSETPDEDVLGTLEN